MFTPKEIKAAFLNLYGMFDEETREDLEESFGREMGVSFNTLAQAMRAKATHVHDFRTESDVEHPFQYNGRRLFKQKASPILSYLDYTLEEGNLCIECCTELWIKQDMTFAVLHCYRMKVTDGERLRGFCEYRQYAKTIKSPEDIFFTPEDFMYEVDDICLFQMLFG